MHSFGGKDLISAWEIPCELLLLKLYEVFEIYRETIKCDGGNTRKNGAVLAVQAALLSPARLGESNSLDMARRHRYPTSPDEGRPDYGLAGADTRQHRRPRS